MTRTLILNNMIEMDYTYDIMYNDARYEEENMLRDVIGIACNVEVDDCIGYEFVPMDWNSGDIKEDADTGDAVDIYIDNTYDNDLAEVFSVYAVVLRPRFIEVYGTSGNGNIESYHHRCVKFRQLGNLAEEIVTRFNKTHKD